MIEPYKLMPGILPSYTTSRHGQTIPCKDCAADTPKLGPTTTRCPACYPEWLKRYKRQWAKKNRWRVTAE